LPLVTDRPPVRPGLRWPTWLPGPLWVAVAVAVVLGLRLAEPLHRSPVATVSASLLATFGFVIAFLLRRSAGWTAAGAGGAGLLLGALCLAGPLGIGVVVALVAAAVATAVLRNR
jgi:hypothetical protein